MPLFGGDLPMADCHPIIFVWRDGANTRRSNEKAGIRERNFELIGRTSACHNLEHHLTKPLLSIRPSRSLPRSFLPCTRNKAPLRTLKSTPTLLTNKASHTAPFLGSSCTLTLCLALILAIYITTLSKFSTAPAAIHYT